MYKIFSKKNLYTYCVTKYFLAIGNLMNFIFCIYLLQEYGKKYPEQGRKIGYRNKNDQVEELNIL